MTFRNATTGRLPRAGAALALAAALAAPAGLFVAGCGKVESSTTGPGTGQISSFILVQIPSSPRVGPGNSITINVEAKDSNGFLLTQDVTVLFSQSPVLGTFNPGTLVLVGGKGSTTFTAGAAVGRTTVRVQDEEGKNVSDPVEISIEQGGGGGGGGTGGDAIDLSTVIWTDANPSAYEVNAKLEGVSFRLPNVCWTHAEWPQNYGFLQRVNASQSVFAKVNGQWWSGAWESLTPAFSGAGGCRVLECIVKHEPHGPFCQVEDNPFWEWYPKSGEEIGFMMSSFIRNHQVPKGATGRSRIVMARWP